jgi:hypothetical protein
MQRSKVPPVNPESNEAYEGVIISVLLFMQTKTIQFGIDRRNVGMADFDPLKDEIDPRVKTTE